MKILKATFEIVLFISLSASPLWASNESAVNNGEARLANCFEVDKFSVLTMGSTCSTQIKSMGFAIGERNEFLLTIERNCITQDDKTARLTDVVFLSQVKEGNDYNNAKFTFQSTFGPHLDIIATRVEDQRVRLDVTAQTIYSDGHRPSPATKKSFLCEYYNSLSANL